MTDLTDKWKKGELKGGVYYVLYYKNDTAEVDIYRRVYSLHDDSEVRFTIQQVTEVLAEVPSYEEWKQLKEYERIVTSYNMKPIDYETACETVNKLLDERKTSKEENAELKEELKDYEYQHKQDGICYNDIFCKLELARKENKQLKELLKECRDEINPYRDFINGKKTFKNLIAKINQALGEDKCQLR